MASRKKAENRSEQQNQMEKVLASGPGGFPLGSCSDCDADCTDKCAMCEEIFLHGHCGFQSAGLGSEISSSRFLRSARARFAEQYNKGNEELQGKSVCLSCFHSDYGQHNFFSGYEFERRAAPQPVAQQPPVMSQQGGRSGGGGGRPAQRKKNEDSDFDDEEEEDEEHEEDEEEDEEDIFAPSKTKKGGNSKGGGSNKNSGVEAPSAVLTSADLKLSYEAPNFMRMSADEIFTWGLKCNEKHNVHKTHMRYV